MAPPLPGTKHSPQLGNSASMQTPKNVPTEGIFPRGALGAFGIFEDPAEPGPSQENEKESNQKTSAKNGLFARLRSSLSHTPKPANLCEAKAPKNITSGVKTEAQSNETKQLEYSPEANAKRDQLWNEEKLNSATLQRLEAKIEKRLRDTSDVHSIDEKLISDLWDSLQRNTDFIAGKWNYVDNENNPIDYEGNPVAECEIGNPTSLQKGRNVVIPEDGKFRRIERHPLFERIDGASSKDSQEYYPTNRVAFEKGVQMLVCETPDHDEVSRFCRMLMEKNIKIVIDMTPAKNKFDYGTYAPRRTDPSEPADVIDQLSIKCTHSQGGIRFLANLKRVCFCDNGKKGMIDRIHVNPAVHKLNASALNKIANLFEELQKIHSQGKQEFQAVGTLVHGPDCNGDSAMVMTFLSAVQIVNNAIGSDSPLLNHELVIRSALKSTAIGRVLGGANFVHKKEQFELILKALLERFGPLIEHAQREKKKEAKEIAKQARNNFVPQRILDAANREIEVLKEKVQNTKLGARSTDGEIPEPETAGVDSKKKTNESMSAAQQKSTSSPAQSEKPDASKLPNRGNQDSSVKNALWDELEQEKKSLKSVHSRECPDPDYEGETIHYPEATALQYEKAGKKIYVHANEITFTKKNSLIVGSQLPGERAATARAGCSPRGFAACEDFLAKGIESGEGLFQFVSPKAHVDPATSSEQPMMYLLGEAVKKSGAAKLLLGGRYEVKEIVDLPSDAPDCKRRKLTVIDTKCSGEQKEKSIILTQAGLRFEENKLCAHDLVRADEMMKSHLSENEKIDGNANRDPIVVSYTGIGRNATLIAYRQVCKQLGSVKSVGDLDALLKQVVSDGRRDRGPGFIHSAAQLAELRDAAAKAFAELHPPGKGEGRKESSTTTSAPDHAAGQSAVPGTFENRKGTTEDAASANGAEKPSADPVRNSRNVSESAGGIHPHSSADGMHGPTTGGGTSTPASTSDVKSTEEKKEKERAKIAAEILAELHRREARQADQNAAQAKSEEQRQSDGAGSGMDTANGR